MIILTLSLVAGCGKKSADSSGGSSGGGLLGSAADKMGGTGEDSADSSASGEAKEDEAPAVIPGHYDLWTFSTSGGDAWVDHYITYLGSVWNRTAVGRNYGGGNDG
jgi:hypothetical protein